MSVSNAVSSCQSICQDASQRAFLCRANQSDLFGTHLTDV